MIKQTPSRRGGRWLFVLAVIAGSFMFLVGSATGTISGPPASAFNSGDGNMTNDSSAVLDWQGAATHFGSSYTGDIPDLFSTGTDDAFTPGQKIDSPCPDISGQSSPPKDDFTAAAYASETISDNIFLYGATFRFAANGNASENVELNHGTNGKCPDNADGTPSKLFKRVAGDRLIAIDYVSSGAKCPFDASKTGPACFAVATWITTGVKGDCFVGNDLPPCWGATVVSLDASESEGAVNQTATKDYIQSNGGTNVDALKFAEFGVNLTRALGISGCGTITGTEIEARSSGSSFVSSPKDIVIGTKPINPCRPTLVTSSSGGTISSNGSFALSDTATLSGGTSDATGTLTFNLYSDANCTTLVGSNTQAVNGANGVSYASDPVTVFAAGTYHWRVKYDSTDLKNSSVPFTACGADGENPVVARAPDSISTTLSAGLIVAGNTVHDSATLNGATTDAGGSVTYSVYTSSTCTGTKFANGGTVTVTNGVVPDSNGVTFNSAGTFYWQASYSGDANNAPSTSTCTSEQLTVIGPCSTGYPSTSGTASPLQKVAFNESEVLRYFQYDSVNNRIELFYNDEHALALGVSKVTVNGVTTDYTGNTAPYPGTPPSGGLSPVKTGAPYYTPAQLGDDPATVTPLNLAIHQGTMSPAGAPGSSDSSGRPLFPSLFVTDITSNPNATSGDWQIGGAPKIPSTVFGSWKYFTESITSTSVTLTGAADPAKNNWTLGAGSDTPKVGFAALKNEGYGAEARWNVSDLGLSSGHAYRLYFMDHDGDQNKTGGDSGQACLHVVIP
jgi:hypothetical protein